MCRNIDKNYDMKSIKDVEKDILKVYLKNFIIFDIIREYYWQVILQQNSFKTKSSGIRSSSEYF